MMGSVNSMKEGLMT